MDALITTIVAGIIVALVSAFAAYYFSGRQEEQKRIFERQSAEQQRLDAQQRQLDQQQKELDERRRQILDGLRSLAIPIIEDFRTWVTRAANLDDKLPPIEVGYNFDMLDSWQRFIREIHELRSQGENIANEIASLESYYRQQKPYLDFNTQKVFESFDNDLSDRHITILEQLRLVADAFEERGLAAEIEELLGGDFGRRSGEGTSLMDLLAEWWHREDKSELAEASKIIDQQFLVPLMEIIEDNRNWNARTYLGALDSEVQKLGGPRR